MVHNKFSVILILIASAIAPVVAPPPPVISVTGQGSHLDLIHSPSQSPNPPPRHPNPNPPHPERQIKPLPAPSQGSKGKARDLNPAVQPGSPNIHRWWDTLAETALLIIRPMILRSSNLNLPKKSKKRKHSDLVDKQLNDFESEFHEHFKTFTPAQNEKDANIESRYCVKFQLNVLFYPDGKDSRRGIKTEKRNGYER